MNDLYLDSQERCNYAGIGLSSPMTYFKGGRSEPCGEILDVAFCVKSTNENRLYGLFTGYNGSSRVAKFSANRMVYEMGETHSLCSTSEVDSVGDVLRDSYKNVEKCYERELSEMLSQKKILEMQHETAANKEKISQLASESQVGSTALIVFMVDKRLFVLNCGNSRLLLISMEGNKYRCVDPNENDAANDLEVERLSNIELQHSFPPRGIGDTFRNRTLEVISQNNDQFTSEPEIMAINIDPSCRYLLLVSTGVIRTIEELHGDGAVNINNYIMDSILHEVHYEHTSSLVVAQGCVDRIGRMHSEKFCKGELQSNHREGMAIIVVDLMMANQTEYPVSSLLETQLSEKSNGDRADPYVDVDNLESLSSCDQIRIQLEAIGMRNMDDAFRLDI